MSSLHRRRRDRRAFPNQPNSSMHPGWACLMIGIFSGLMLGVGFASISYNGTIWPGVIGFILGLVAFWRAGRLAERLMVRP